jgi:hypothetical protein
MPRLTAIKPITNAGKLLKIKEADAKKKADR